MDNEDRLEVLELAKWKDLIDRKALDQLETKILPNYLMHLRWFGGKGRGLENISIVDTAALPAGENNIFILLLEVSYRDGLPDMYQLPVAWGKGQFGFKLQDNCPQSVVCLLNINGEDGVLYDAIYGFDMQEAIIQHMAAHQTVSQRHGDLVFSGTRALKKHMLSQVRVKPKVMSAEQSNTSITYDNAWYLKIYRKVDKAINPDVEITRFLSKEAGFKHIPEYIGAVEWKTANNQPMVLGMMQEMGICHQRRLELYIRPAGRLQ